MQEVSAASQLGSLQALNAELHSFLHLAASMVEGVNDPPHAVKASDTSSNAAADLNLFNLIRVGMAHLLYLLVIATCFKVHHSRGFFL